MAIVGRNTHARAKFRGDATRGERRKIIAVCNSQSIFFKTSGLKQGVFRLLVGNIRVYFADPPEKEKDFWGQDCSKVRKFIFLSLE